MEDIILAVDTGEKNIGLAKSDPLGLGATPLCVIPHVQREKDAAAIVEKAREVGAVRILVGQPLNADGSAGPHARHAEKVAEAIRQVFDGEVFLWDEYGSTQGTRALFREMGAGVMKSRGHLDANAAAFILNDYLNDRAIRKEAAAFAAEKNVSEEGES